MARTMRRTYQRKYQEKVVELDYKVICPYFINTTKIAVACNSVISGAVNYTRFKDENKYNNFSLKFCQSFDYKKCPQYKLYTTYLKLKETKLDLQKSKEKLNNIKSALNNINVDK